MKSIINYFNTSIWTIISFLLVIVLILIPLASFLSYSFFTVEGVEIIHQFSLINYKEFFIDEINIQENIVNWQNQIGYVPQNISLIEGNIRENILSSNKLSKEDRELIERLLLRYEN